MTINKKCKVRHLTDSENITPFALWHFSLKGGKEKKKKAFPPRREQKKKGKSISLFKEERRENKRLIIDF